MPNFASINHSAAVPLGLCWVTDSHVALYVSPIFGGSINEGVVVDLLTSVIDAVFSFVLDVFMVVDLDSAEDAVVLCPLDAPLVCALTLSLDELASDSA